MDLMATYSCKVMNFNWAHDHPEQKWLFFKEKRECIKVQAKVL